MRFLKNIFSSKKQFEFKQDTTGLHQLGGDLPSDFKIPSNEFIGGFQYLGMINHTDKYYQWLSFPLHLICPIFTEFDHIFLDYTDPKAPKLIYPEKTWEITTAYEELDKDSYIIYNKVNFSLLTLPDGINEDKELDLIAIGGTPHGQQSFGYPTCPKSNREMKFVCQIMSNNLITAKEKNFHSEDDYYERLFTDLNFWCNGSLKVFFEPTSKVACYFIQHT